MGSPGGSLLRRTDGMGIKKNAHAYTWAFMFWSRQQDLNLRPTHYECAALPAELYRH